MKETPKQFVESRYPLAECRYKDCGIPYAGTYRVVTKIGGTVLGTGTTASQAWFNAANYILAEDMKK
jgi:hypothetical protein